MYTFSPLANSFGKLSFSKISVPTKKAYSRCCIIGSGVNKLAIMVIVLPPSPFLLELGLRSNFQKGGRGFTGSPFLEGIAGKEGGGGGGGFFFGGGGGGV